MVPGDSEAPWPARPPEAPVFFHLDLPGGEAAGPEPVAPPAAAGPVVPPPEIVLGRRWAWVERSVKALAVACLAAALLAPLAAFFRPNEPIVVPRRVRPTVRPPIRVRPYVPSTTQPPASTTTVVPGTSQPAQRVCGIVRDDEAASVLGAPVVSRTPGTTEGVGRPMAACVISTVATGAPGGAQLVVAVGTDIDYLLAQANEPTATNLGVGLDSYVADHPDTTPHTVALGILDASRSVIFEIVGSTAANNGVDPATQVLVAARSRL